MKFQAVNLDTASAANSINEAIVAQLDSLRTEIRKLGEEEKLREGTAI